LSTPIIIGISFSEAKYSNYPNPGASAWVSKKYQQAGGQYVETTEASRRANMAKKIQENAKNKERESNKDTKNSKKEKDKGKK
jgi:hypothetical protein